MKAVRDINERRKYLRINGKYMVRHESFTVPRGALIQEGAAKNISANGLLFESRIPYDLGAILFIELLVPGIDKFKTEFYKHERLTDTKPFAILGKVVRVELAREGVFDIGVGLVGIDYVHQRALAKFIGVHAKKG